MRKVLVPLIVVVLLALLGVISWQLLLSQRQQAQMAGEVTALRKDIAESTQQSKLTHEALDQAGQSLAAENDAASLLMRGDVTAIAAMRTAIAEYYASMGKMPEKPADAGLSAPEAYRGKTLRSATLQGDGSIDLVFDANSGVDGGHVYLRPDLAHADTMGIQWRCETSDYPQIKRALATCDYVGHQAPAIAQ